MRPVSQNVRCATFGFSFLNLSFCLRFSLSFRAHQAHLDFAADAGANGVATPVAAMNFHFPIAGGSRRARRIRRSSIRR